MTHLDRLDGAVGLEITAVHGVEAVLARLVAADDPLSALSHVRVDEEAHRFGDARGLALLAEDHRPHVAGHHLGMGLEIVLGGFLQLGGRELRLKTLHIDLTVTGQRHGDDLAPRPLMIIVLGVQHSHGHGLQRVGGSPFATVLTRVQTVSGGDQILDGPGIRGFTAFHRGHGGAVHGRQLWGGQRLDVPRLAGGRQRERVLSNRHGGQELLGRGTTHRAGHREHGHVLQVETLEDALVGAALVVVRLLHALLVDGERVSVLHDELAAADQARARAELVAVLGLDLVERDRQVLVRGVHILDQQREHFLMRGGEQVVGLVTVLQTEQVLAVFLPAVGGLIRLARQQRREVDLLGADAVDLLADDGLDLVEDLQTQRQPGPDTRSRLAHIAGAQQQFRRIGVGVGGILAQRAQEHGGHSKCFGTHGFQGIRVRGHCGPGSVRQTRSIEKGPPPGAHRASGLRIGLAAVPLLSRHPAQPFEGNAGRQHGHRQDGHQRHVDTGMGQRIGRGRLAPGNYARVRARLGGRRAITRRATRHGTGLVLLIAARRGAVRSGLRDDSAAGGSSERPSTVARMVPVRLFLFACVADAAVRPADAAEIHVRSRQRGCLHYARGSRLSYRPGQYVAERIIVAFISALSLTVIAIADFSNRMVEKNLVAIAAYVLLPALAATSWLRTCHQWPTARPATCAGYSVPPRATRQASNRCNRSQNASHSCASAPLPGESPISTISNGTFAGLMSSSAQ